MDNSEIPVEYLCPITKDIMEDPVLAPDGYTYERISIIQHLDFKKISPMTRQEMKENQLITNRALKDSIDRWQKMKKTFTDFANIYPTEEVPDIYFDSVTNLYKYRNTDNLVFEYDVEAFSDNFKYKGTIILGKLHGKGRLFNVGNDKKVYEGWFSENLRHGKGVSFYENEKRNYQGEWFEGQRHGKGVSFYENEKVSYEGDFSENLAHGKGVQYYESGQKEYEGGYCKNYWHGKGIRYYSNGNIKYRGEFVKGDFHGKGVQYYANGQKMYEGDFCKNNWHGQGIRYYSNGRKKYEGDFCKNYWNGKGTEYCFNGRPKKTNVRRCSKRIRKKT